MNDTLRGTTCAYNIVRIDERHDALRQAYAEYAPRYDGDDEYDVRTLMGSLREAVDAANAAS